MRQEETIRREILEQRIDRELEALSEKLFGKKLEDASDEQVYVALLYLDWKRQPYPTTVTRKSTIFLPSS